MKVIYIGELGSGTRTADDDFFEMMEWIDNDDFEVQRGSTLVTSEIMLLD
ncbi:hypothetical protein [Paenibacillus sp. RC67]|nr:hypothetical protein [Paenibacillus sp. RC67]